MCIAHAALKLAVPAALLLGNQLPAQPTVVVAEVAKQLASDGRFLDSLGVAVDVDGDRTIVGANSGGPLRSGAAYVFERTPQGAWIEVADLTASDSQEGDLFGSAVAIEGDLVAVGSPDASGTQGAVYLYERSDEGEWLETQRLSPAGSGDRFGTSMFIDGDRLAIGADQRFSKGGGALYLFEQADGSWELTETLLASNRVTGDLFGCAVSLSGDQLVVGACLADTVGGNETGSAYVFERDGEGDWHETAQLFAEDAEEGDDFGYAVSIDNGRLAVGARQDDVGNLADVGTVTLFERMVDGVWFESARLDAPNPEGQDFFGSGVALDQDLLAVGNRFDNETADGAGAVLLYERQSEAVWSEIAKLTPLDAQREDGLGATVALDGARVVSGATAEDDNGTNAGAAYVFEPVVVDPKLALFGPCPGPFRLVLADVTPRSRIEVYGSLNVGLSEIEEGNCAGTELGLGGPAKLLQKETGFIGVETLEGILGPARCGSALQLLDLETCLTSQVVVISAAPTGRPAR